MDEFARSNRHEDFDRFRIKWNNTRDKLKYVSLGTHGSYSFEFSNLTDPEQFALKLAFRDPRFTDDSGHPFNYIGREVATESLTVINPRTYLEPNNTRSRPRQEHRGTYAELNGIRGLFHDALSAGFDGENGSIFAYVAEGGVHPTTLSPVVKGFLKSVIGLAYSYQTNVKNAYKRASGICTQNGMHYPLLLEQSDSFAFLPEEILYPIFAGPLVVMMKRLERRQNPQQGPQEIQPIFRMSSDSYIRFYQGEVEKEEKLNPDNSIADRLSIVVTEIVAVAAEKHLSYTSITNQLLDNDGPLTEWARAFHEKRFKRDMPLLVIDPGDPILLISLMLAVKRKVESGDPIYSHLQEPGSIWRAVANMRSEIIYLLNSVLSLSGSSIIPMLDEKGLMPGEDKYFAVGQGSDRASDAEQLLLEEFNSHDGN